MSQQNLKNHTRLVIGFHVITALALLALLIGSIINLVKSSDANVYSASLILLGSIIGLSLWYYIRTFSLKAQDRAIRAEENFRYFALTSKRLSSKITMSQIIALRFASDEELPGLVDETVTKNLSQKEIKSSIKNWRPDHYRA